MSKKAFYILELISIIQICKEHIVFVKKILVDVPFCLLIILIIEYLLTKLIQNYYRDLPKH